MIMNDRERFQNIMDYKPFAVCRHIISGCGRKLFNVGAKPKNTGRAEFH